MTQVPAPRRTAKAVECECGGGGGVFYGLYLCPDSYMRFVSAVIHAVLVMRSEECHQSVNLKGNGQISPSPSRQTKERGVAMKEESGAIQSSSAKSAPLREGEGGLEVVGED